MEFNCWLWKGMENYSVCGTEIIAGVDWQGQHKIGKLCQKIPENKDDFRKSQLNLRSWKTRKSQGKDHGKSWDLKSSKEYKP